MGCVDGSTCAGLGVIVVRGRVLLLVSLLLLVVLSLLLSLFVSWGEGMVLFFVDGYIGVGAVGSLGVIRATRGRTFSFIKG